jgi:hypothetical protein
MPVNISTHDAPPAWTQPGWLNQANVWIERALAREGMVVVGTMETVHERPWSIVLRVPTAVKDFYFKACAPVLAYEAGITGALYRWRPDCIPAVLDIDVQKGWLLIADGGQTLRQAFASDRGGHGTGTGARTAPTMDIWREILALYASLQIDLAGHVHELLRLGAPDRRLALLPDLYRDLLLETEWLLIDEPDSLTAAEYARLQEATPQVTAFCQELEAYGIPVSLHHNDLHDANLFFSDSRPLFFDWGDSSVAHPFFSLRTVFVSVEYSFGLHEADPFFNELAHAYLQPWTAVAAIENLTAAFKLAQRLWALSTALKYKRQLRHLPALREEYALAIPGSLQEFLEANPEF